MKKFSLFLLCLTILPVPHSVSFANTDKVWPQMYKKARPSIVRVRCGIETGAGVFLQTRNTILTSSSIAGCGRTIWVQLRPGVPERQAKMLKASARWDLALLYLPDSPATIRPLVLSRTQTTVGQAVGLIGHPFLDRGPLIRRSKALQRWSFAKGVVSQITPQILQINAPLMGGFIGAPILSSKGEVLGMLSESSPWGQPMGKAIPAKAIAHFLKPTTQPPRWPYFTYEILLQARISYPLVDTTASSLPASTQELRLDLIFADQWIVGFIVGIDLLSLSSDYTFSLVSAVHLEYRWIMPRLARPYVDYIGFGVGVIASQINVQKKIQIQLDLENLELQGLGELFRIRQRFSIWVGLRFYAFLGKFSVGVFLDPAAPTNPVFTVAWGFTTKT